MPEPPQLEALGDAAWLLRWGETIDARLNTRVHAAAARIAAQGWPWVEDLVPAYASLAVFVDRAQAASAGLRFADVETCLHHLFAEGSIDAEASEAAAAPFGDQAAIIDVPVHYGGEFGPDLAAVAAETGLDEAEVIARHSGAVYRVAMLGFAPGFPYLLGLDPALTVARLATPRLRVPAGSVAIAGAQTGIYPNDGPGGWRLLGRTPLRLFDPRRQPPCLFAPGQRLRFIAVGSAPVDAAA